MQGDAPGFASELGFVAGGITITPVVRGQGLHQTHDFHVRRGGVVGVDVTRQFELGPVAIAQAARQAVAELQISLVANLGFGQQVDQVVFFTRWVRGDGMGRQPFGRLIPKQAQPLADFLPRQLGLAAGQVVELGGFFARGHVVGSLRQGLDSSRNRL